MSQSNLNLQIWEQKNAPIRKHICILTEDHLFSCNQVQSHTFFHLAGQKFVYIIRYKFSYTFESQKKHQPRALRKMHLSLLLQLLFKLEREFFDIRLFHSNKSSPEICWIILKTAQTLQKNSVYRLVLTGTQLMLHLCMENVSHTYFLR